MIFVTLRHVEQQVALRAPSAVSLVTVVEGQNSAFLIMSVQVLIQCHAQGSNGLVVIAAFLGVGNLSGRLCCRLFIFLLFASG